MNGVVYGEDLRRARVAAGLSQDALADLAGVSQTAVSKAEAAETADDAGRVDTLRRIAEGLSGVPGDARPVGARVRDLRLALGLSQRALGERTGGELDQSYVTKIEAGRNLASTLKVRAALADGFGLSLATLNEYLAGALTVEAAVAEAGAPAPAPAAQPSALEESLGRAFRPAVHRLCDTQVVLAALRNTPVPAEDLDAMAGEWLLAAADMRVRGERVDAASLLVRITASMVVGRVS